MRSLLAAAAHIAIWAGLYIAAATLCFAHISGLYNANYAIWLRAAAFSFTLATAVYLLDRVKLRDAWLDPADAQAHPARYNFLEIRTSSMRVCIFLLYLLSIWLAAPLTGSFAVASLLPTLAILGVLAYAAKPRQHKSRPKDLLFFKNAYVAAGITAFGALTSLAAAGQLPVLSRVRTLGGLLTIANVPFWISAIHLFIRVFADAVLCDLDDHAADVAHGTRTLPGWLGRARAWNIAMLARLAIAVILAALAFVIPQLPRTLTLCWCGVTIVSSIALRLSKPKTLRDWVDARFAVEAVVVLGLINLFS